jgi:hypothetical protein
MVKGLFSRYRVFLGDDKNVLGICNDEGYTQL